MPNVSELPEIPAMHLPPTWSVFAFVAIVLSIVVCFLSGDRASSKLVTANDLDFGNKDHVKTRSWNLFPVLICAWLGLGAILPISGVLETPMLPPSGLLYAGVCFLVAAVFVFSSIGKRFALLPFAVLIGFHAFRFPLELILHFWYVEGTVPVQMTYSGLNFDIITGVLALVVGVWAWQGRPQAWVFWAFNIIGTTLLLTVVVIAVLSTPVPFRQFHNEPPVLLPFIFPYSYIVSVAVTGGLIGHGVIFRKLMTGKMET